MFVEAPEEAFEIGSADAQVLDRLAREKVHQPSHRAIERALPYQFFASREFQEFGRLGREWRVIVLPPNGNVVPRPVAEGGQGFVGYDFAVAHNRHAVAQLLDLAERMAGEEHGVSGGGELS